MFKKLDVKKMRVREASPATSATLATQGCSETDKKAESSKSSESSTVQFQNSCSAEEGFVRMAGSDCKACVNFAPYAGVCARTHDGCGTKIPSDGGASCGAFERIIY